MILIYIPAITKRANYIFSLFFSDLSGIEYDITNSQEAFTLFEGPKICYANEPLTGGLFIKSDPLLFTKGTLHMSPSTGVFNGIPAIFLHHDSRSCLPFDPFAAGFYMVSRYEEYVSPEKDNFGRFRQIDSIAHVGNFIDQPVVNIWAALVMQLLLQHYPGIPSRTGVFQFIPSIDIDHAYAYGHRKMSRILGGFMRDFKNADFHSIRLRTMVLAGRKKDPYDNYDRIRELHDHYDIKPLLFILFADYGGNDNNVSIDDPDFQHLIRTLDRYAEVGIHPSLISNRRFSVLENEVFGLADLLDRDILISRQHFLKIKLPFTYRNLIRLGITDDFSMSYASTPGFRAGIACPFPFFDLITDEITDLKIHPVSVMDVTYKDYLDLGPEESLVQIKKMIDTVRSVNGEFISLWHNESFNFHGRWAGWEEVYQEMLKYGLK